MRDILQNIVKKIKGKLNITKTIFLIAIVGLINIAVMYFVTVYGEINNSFNSMVKAVDTVADSYLADSESEKMIEDSIMKTYQSEVSVINHIFSDYDIQKYSYDERSSAAGSLKIIKERSSCNDMFVCDRHGNIYIAADTQSLDDNLCDNNLMAKDQFGELISDADRTESYINDAVPTGIYVQYNGSTSCCFSKKILDTEDKPTPYYLIVVYDMETVNNSITEWVDKTVLAQTVSDHISMMDFIIIKNDDVIFSSIDTSQFTSVDFQDRESGYLNTSAKGKCGRIILTNEDTGSTQKFDDGYMRTIEKSNGEKYQLVCLLNIAGEGTAIVYRFGGLLWCAMALIVVVMCYIVYWFASFRTIRKRKTFISISTGVAVALICIFGIFAYYFQSLEDLTEVTVTADKVYNQIKNLNYSQQLKYDSLVEYYKEADLTKAGLVAYDVEFSGNRLNTCSEERNYYDADEYGNTITRKDRFGNDMVCYAAADILADKTSMLNDADIWLLNDKGFAIASSNDNNWSFNCNTDTDCEIIRKVMYGELPYVIDYYDGDNSEIKSQIIYPVNLYAYSNDNSNTKYISYQKFAEAGNDNADSKEKPEKLMGVLLIRTYKEPDAINVSRINFSNSIETIVSASECSYADLYYNSENSTVTISNKIQGLSKDLNLDEINVPMGIASNSVFSYFQDISRTKCYVRATKDVSGSSAGAVVYKMSVVHAEREKMVKIYIIFSAITIVIVHLLLLSSVKNAYDSEGNKFIKDNEPLHEVDKFQNEDSDSSNINGRIKSKLSQMSLKPTQIPLFIIRIIIILTAVFVIRSMFIGSSDNETGVFVNIYSNEWERCVNSYNIGAAIALLTLIYVVFNFIKSIVVIYCVPLGRKVETYARLVISIIQYVLIFIGVFYGAYLLGMELKSIGTFATVITGVIGIGSQQLISDVGAGIAMLTDGRFMIGDLITIDGFTGIIKEIGIRNCIVVNEDGIIKTVSNGKMNNALLLSKSPQNTERNENHKTESNTSVNIIDNKQR